MTLRRKPAPRGQARVRARQFRYRGWPVAARLLLSPGRAASRPGRRKRESDMSDLPPRQGLYDPRNEHDACGVGFIADIKGRKSHDIVRQGLSILVNLDHRGAVGADPLVGDGAGQSRSSAFASLTLTVAVRAATCKAAATSSATHDACCEDTMPGPGAVADSTASATATRARA